jgi:anthranilate phosphoribosyltransferase
MAIGMYLREIGRGKQGARALTRAQSCDLFGQLLDGAVSDLEVGAFCIAMRVKGETVEEVAGFLDALQARLQYVAPSDTAGGRRIVVIPSYNGARRLPLLLPLLALLLARQGLAVLIHGTATEPGRIFTTEVLQAFDIAPLQTLRPITPGEVQFAPTALLCAGLQRLLEVRQVLKLRNPAHSLVKLMNPCSGRSLLVSSYTHPEYAVTMAQTLELQGRDALLLRGTEGEAVADPRRTPRMQAFLQGREVGVYSPQGGSLAVLPEMPAGPEIAGTVSYIHRVLDGAAPVPQPIAEQVSRILHLADSP